MPLAYSIHEGNTGRIRFHGTPAALLREQADALGLELIQAGTHPDDFESVYLRLLEELVGKEVEGVVYGNIHLRDVRAWYEERTRREGLSHLEPLWGGAPREIAREFVDLGYRATVVGVDLTLGDPSWLGRELDHAFVDQLEGSGVDACGERGEYHTFVWDGPLFRKPVGFRTGRILERDGHQFLDLLSGLGGADG